MSVRTPAPATPAGADRIAATFARCRAAGEAALVAYVMGGDPDLATSTAMALACVEGGADLLEIGIPFSDPIADGPTIQRAAERALAAGTTLADVLQVARAVRTRSEAPIALMGYLNPILAYGAERFVSDASRAGVDALIVPDLLPEEAGDLGALAAARGLAVVFLLAPTSTPARIETAARAATGFLYFVSVTGVTGARTAVPADVGARVAAVRARSPVPVVIGFGVSTPGQAAALAPLADGVVVGSAIVSRVAQAGARAVRAARVRRFVAGLKRALRPRGRAPARP
ncbi:MAG TPA: tryptophan synthase subunit alpha [Anaeromyxobacteraceae bacterium]|nr:tryptophan synthase subunit alpha [Anaeromyxobacteraceae bacterium]